jgi:hypothetical protein
MFGAFVNSPDTQVFCTSCEAWMVREEKVIGLIDSLS